MLRRGPDRLSRDAFVTEFGVVRGLGLGTLWWVGLSLGGAILVGLTGAYGWSLLRVLGCSCSRGSARLINQR